jgi:FMN phosphatase YigB (HAD superfamily)
VTARDRFRVGDVVEKIAPSREDGDWPTCYHELVLAVAAVFDERLAAARRAGRWPVWRPIMVDSDRGRTTLQWYLESWRLMVQHPPEPPDPAVDDIDDPEAWADYCATYDHAQAVEEHENKVAMIAFIEYLLYLDRTKGPQW